MYYDKDDVLSRHGIWIRRRGKEWEAKVRKGGDYINAQFDEITGYSNVESVVRNLVQDARVVEDNVMGLSEIARFTTTRESLWVNDRFEVAIDESNFGHIVGEVELVDESERYLGYSVGEDAGDVYSMLDKEIEVFMKEYGWAFPLDQAKGKLSAYFAWKEEEKKKIAKE